MAAAPMKKAVVWFVLLLAAFALRVYALDAQSLWYDEAVTADVAGRGIAELTRWTANDIQPPLYYYLVAGWTGLAGRSEWALRFPSAFFGVLTVALLGRAGRWVAGRRGAQIAALLGAASPLYVYYSQEARMYALLTFLGLLTGCVLHRAATAQGRRETGAWIAFVAASVAMLYTHYFGGFLLAAYILVAIVAGWVAWRRGDPVYRRAVQRKAGRGSIALLAIGVLYAPWLPFMLNRYAVDASYWPGALKFGEAVRHLVISFVAGAPETMLEAHAVRWAAVVGVALIGAAAGWWRARRGAGPWAAVALWVVLLAPTAAVLVLASRTPKFNPRYLMLVSPAYFLFLAGGLANLTMRTRGARIVGWLALALVLAPALLSVWNGYYNLLFTKAQWREAAAYIRQELGPGEAVVLVSGHAAPAWHYYAPQIAPVRLPPIDILDVNRVLGFDDAAALGEALAGKRGAWLVTWQDDVVDPLGIVTFLLDRAGEAQPVARQFRGLGVRHWHLSPDAAFPTAPQPGHETGANFDHKVALLGWDDPQAGELTVYWRALNTLTADYQVSLILEDAAGREVGRWDGRPAGYNYPAPRWPVGAVVFGRYGLPAAAPGEYTVSLAVYAPEAPAGLDVRDVADNPAGKRVRLGPLRLP